MFIVFDIFHLNLIQFLLSGELDCALQHADCALKYWPYHMNVDNLAVHVREYVECRLLQTVQKEMDAVVESEKLIKLSIFIISFFEFMNQSCSKKITFLFLLKKFWKTFQFC